MLRRLFIPNLKESAFAAQFSLRLLMCFFCFIGISLYIWHNTTVFPKAEALLGDTLGDNYPLKLPDLSLFVIKFHHSPWWALGLFIPLSGMAYAWIVRPPWLIAVGCAFIFMWAVAFSSVPFFGFWFADEAILQAVKKRAKDIRLLPKNVINNSVIESSR
jgi:hypothetical protein